MLSKANRNALESNSSEESSSDFIIKLLSADLTVNQLIKSSSHVTSLFVPYVNDIITYALLNPDEIRARNLNSKLCSSATRILESNNISIKSKILKTIKFKEAVTYLLDQTNISYDDYFVSKFASITESYLKNSPQLIKNEFSFFITFSRFIISNFSVYSLFKNILTSSSFNSYLIYNYLQEHQFADFLFNNLADESIDLLILCSRIDVFRTPNFIHHILNFGSNELLDDKIINRKWEIIAEYVQITMMSAEDEERKSINSLKDFLPLVSQAVCHINPLNFDNYLKSQVASLKFLISMLYNSSLKAESEVCNISNLMDILKNIIILFPNHTIAVNQVFMLAETLIISTSLRSQAIQAFIPFVYKLLMFQKIQYEHPKEESDSNEKDENHSEASCIDQPKSNTLYSFFNQCNLTTQSEFSTDSNSDSSPIKCQTEDEGDFVIISANVDDDDVEENLDEESNKIKAILSPGLRGFAACFLNRLMVDEDNDTELEKELNDNDLFNESTEYLVEFYNPLSESGYGYTNGFQFRNNQKINAPYLDMKARNLFVLI